MAGRSRSKAYGRHYADADDWLNFMLSQKNLWPTFATRGTLTEEVSEKIFRKERRRLQAKHLWMDFFFLHCRASAKHSRSTTGNMK